MPKGDERSAPLSASPPLRGAADLNARSTEVPEGPAPMTQILALGGDLDVAAMSKGEERVRVTRTVM